MIKQYVATIRYHAPAASHHFIIDNYLYVQHLIISEYIYVQHLIINELMLMEVRSFIT
jgi:hypothetical protein